MSEFETTREDHEVLAALHASGHEVDDEPRAAKALNGLDRRQRPVADVDDVDQAVLDDRVAPHHDLVLSGGEDRVLLEDHRGPLGQVRDDLDPHLAAAQALILMVGYLSMEGIIAASARPLEDPALRERWREAAVDLVVHGVRAA